MLYYSAHGYDIILLWTGRCDDDDIIMVQAHMHTCARVCRKRPSAYFLSDKIIESDKLNYFMSSGSHEHTYTQTYL